MSGESKSDPDVLFLELAAATEAAECKESHPTSKVLKASFYTLWMAAVHAVFFVYLALAIANGEPLLWWGK